MNPQLAQLIARLNHCIVKTQEPVVSVTAYLGKKEKHGLDVDKAAEILAPLVQSLDQANAALIKALKRPEVVITKAEVIALNNYAANNDDESDTEYCLVRMPAWHCEEFGDQRPGLYLSYEESPEEGLIGPIAALTAPPNTPKGTTTI